MKRTDIHFVDICRYIFSRKFVGDSGDKFFSGFFGKSSYKNAFGCNITFGNEINSALDECVSFACPRSSGN